MAMEGDKTMRRYHKVIHLFTIATTILWSIGLPLSALLPNKTLASVTREYVVSPGSPVYLKGGVNNSSVFGLDLAVSASETLSSVRVTLGARGGEFAAADLATMGTGAGSGLALYKDNKSTGTFGSLDGGDAVVTLGAAPTLAASRLSKLTPTATAAVTDSSMSLAVGDLVYANTSSYYSWHMVTTGATGVSSSSLRLDSSASAPTFSTGSRLSQFTPSGTGSYTINGTANSPSSGLAVGDIVYYLNTSTSSGAWGVVTTALTATALQVSGASLASGTYQISKLAVTSGQFVVASSASITPSTVGSAGGDYTAPAAGDIVFATSLGWGVVTDATLTSGTFAINGRVVASGTYVISKLTGYAPTSAAITDGSMTITAGDLAISSSVMDPPSGNYGWHIVTTGATGVAGTALRLDQAPYAPMWSWTALLTPAAGAAIPADNTGNNANADFFVTVSTAASPTNGHKFSLGISQSGDVMIGAYSSTAIMNQAGFVMIDTSAPTIQSVTGFAGSTTLNVRFSKPVQKVGGGNIALADTPLSFTDNGTTTGHTITAISHTAGQDFATLTLSDVLDSGDFDGTPSTLAAGATKIADMSGTVMGTGAVSLTSPLTITTNALPAATVGTAYTTTLTASGGTGTLNASNPWSVLSGSLPAGLSLNQTTGVISGTPTTAGTPNFTIKVIDNAGTPNEATKFFTMSVATTGGGVPGITSVSPAALSINTTAATVTVTGTNTHFGLSSVVSFSGSNVTVGSIIGTPTSTSISVSVAIAAGAATGQRNVTVTTASASETVTMTNGFTVLSGTSSGLTLQAPANASTGVPLPPNFNFSPSSNNSVQSYEIIIKADQAFTGTTLWDYAFPTLAVDASSHCSSLTCNVGYGTGFYRTLVPPTPLAANTTYYWQVKTYNTTPCGISPAFSGCTAATSLESTNINSFTTGSLVDTMPPGIQHRPVMQLKTGADRILLARVGDNVATSTSTPALSTSLVYCNSSTSCTPGTSISGVYVAAGYWKYVIPQAVVDHANSTTNGIRYYLTASDGTNSANFKQPDGTTPFTITIAALATTHKLVGAVTDQTASCLATVFVFAEGTSFNNLPNGTSCAGGTYSLGSIPPGTYDVVAFKEGYGDRMMSSIFAIPTADSTPAYNFSLTLGASGGGSGSFSNPHVKFTGPRDNMTGISGGQVGFKIFVAFDRAMSQSAVTAPGNVLLKKFSGSTDETSASGTINGATVSGTLSATIAYYAQNTDTTIGPLESNLMVITPTASFGDNKTIAVVITSGVTDTSANPVGGGQCNKQPDGSCVFAFSTGSTFTSGGGGGGGTFGSGAFTAPYVNGTTPKPGSFSVPLNTKLAVTFSESMDDTSLTASTVKLYAVSGTSETLVTTSNYSLDTGKTILTFAPSATLTASSQYRIKVLGGAKASTGVTLAPPGSESTVMFRADFNTGTTSDTGAPTKLGSYPDTGATGVPVNLGAIMVAFSKPLDPSTVSTSTVSLAIGSSTVSGTASYDDTKNAVMFMPKVALSASTSYNLSVSTGVKALNGTAVTTAYNISFTTGTADTVAPTISFANGSDYAIAITYSEPMQAAKATDTTNFSSSVLNPVKYTLNSAALPSSVVMRYEADKNTVMIEGLALTSGTAFTLTVTGVKDLSGNTIAGTPSIGGTVLSSTTTGGMLGPGMTSGGSFSGPTGPDYSSAGISYMPPAQAKPFSIGAGVTTIYGVEIPISKQIPASGKIVVTFPVGFDISGAKKDPNSPPNSDINGPSAGTVVFGTAAETSGGANNDGVTVDAVARTVTVTLGAVPTRSQNSDTHDYLRLDLAGIKNSTVPMDFGTSGYTLDIKTYSGTTLLDSNVSQPFFIGASGSRQITVEVRTASAVTGSMKVYVGSPMTGMQDKTIEFSSGTAPAIDAVFTGLSDGQYMVFTDSIFTNTDDNSEWSGQAMPTPVSIAGGNATKTITLTKLTGAGTTTNVTVYVKGPASEPIEIFAGSPSGFARKKVTLNADADDYQSFTLTLTKGQKWYVGVGPQMPDMSMSGPPPAPSYMPPKPWEVEIAAGGTFKESSVDATPSDALNDGKVTFVLQSAALQINGTVQDGAGNAMANAEVFASNPQAGFGTHTQSNAQGGFTLKVIAGSYSMGAFVQGMPSGQMLPVEVKANGDVFAGGSTTATTNVIIKLAKPDYTISGTISDGTSVISGASVYAYRTDGPGASGQAMTDTQGAYTIYVSNGSWKVGAFVPGYGQLPEKSLTVSGASLTNQNFAPTTSDFGTISGTITRATVPVSGVFVNVQGTSTSGTFTTNDTITGADGTYLFKVPAGTNYTIRAFKPGEGQLPAISNVSVAASGTTAGQDIAVTALNTITFTFSATVTQAFVDMYNSSTNVGNHAEVKNGTTASLSLPSGTYSVKVFVPGVDGANLVLSDTSGIGTTVLSGSTVGSDATVNGAEGITVTLPTLRTISGTVYKTAASAGNELDKAWVELINETNGVRIGGLSITDGTFSLQAPNGTYKIQAMKPGYTVAPATLVVAGNSTGNNVILNISAITVTGRVKIGSSGAARAFVRAEKVGETTIISNQADANGDYTLNLPSGSWRIYGVAEGYQEVQYGSGVIAGSASGIDITLSSTLSLKPPKSKPITPAQGGELIDTDAGVKLTIPASAFGSSTSSGQVQAKETNNVGRSASAKIAGNKAKEIQATDSSGNPITSLNGSVTVEMNYTSADLTAGGIATADEGKLNLAYWDDTANNWVNIPATLDTSSKTLRGNTDHLTVFAIVLPFVATPAAAATVTPSGGGGSISSGFTSASSTFSINNGASTTASSTVTLSLSSTGATQVAISESPDFSGAVWQAMASSVSWQLSAGNGLKTVYVKYRDQNGAVSSRLSATITLNPAATPEEIAAPAPAPVASVSEADRAAQVVTITQEAAKVSTVSAEALAAEVGASRDTGLEQRYSSTIVARVVVASTPAASRARVVNFVTYGTPTTKILGAGERAGVVNSFRAAFGKVPQSEADWADVIKIANGRFPAVTNSTREKSVETTFKKIYLRSAVRTQANDDAAVVVMAYGLRTASRNLASEQAAIKSFKAIFGKAPTTASDWDAVRAIAYSGAKR